MTTHNEQALLEALGEVIEQRKALEAKEKELKAALSTVFEATPNGTVTAGDFAISMRQNAGRKTLNKEALIEAGIDLEPYYKVGKPFMTVSVKRLVD